MTFEPQKESLHLISHTQGFGDSLRLLGVTLDIHLTMEEAVGECSVEAHWRLSALLRSRRFFSVRDFVLHYKAQVLSFLEYRTCAITHGADVHLHALDAIQRRFLRNVGLLLLDALHAFNLAPLSSRRDMANLGILYRAVTRRGPRQLQELFKLDRNVRRSSPRRDVHRFQILDETRELHRDYLNRSTFGYVGVFNLLPDVVFVSEDFECPIPVKEFQKNLNKLVKLASHDVDNWHLLFSPRLPLFDHLIRGFQHVNRVHLSSQ